MNEYKNLQRIISDYFKDKTKEDLEKEIFFDSPELFYEIAKYRNFGMPKRYTNAVKKSSVDHKLFFFESNLAKQYTGNPRYIYERMLERYPNFKYVWSYNGDKDMIPGNPIVVERGSNEYYKYLAKACVLINNTTFPIWFHRKESFYLQTWHGTPYKQMHWDIQVKELQRRSTPHFYVKSRGWDALLSPNHFSTEKFSSGFRYDGNILEYGYPANDIFYDKEKYQAKRAEIRNLLNIEDDALVYLYAPTWRDGGHIGNSMFKFDLMLNPTEFLEHAPEDSILLIRSHHMSESTEALKGLEGRAIDVSGFDDAIEIMCASDVLITDYSSIVFDWYCSKKPVLYFVPDLDKYVNTLRGTYFDIEEVNCGPVCKTNEELYENLDVKNAKFYKDFYEEFCSLHDRKSADKVIDYIVDLNKESFKGKMDKNLRKGYKKIFS